MTQNLDDWLTQEMKKEKENTPSTPQKDTPVQAKPEVSFVRGLFSREKKPVSSPAPTKPAHPGQHTRPSAPMPKAAHKPAPQAPRGKVMRFIPLGGLEEIGRNCALFEYDNDMFLFDVGLQFPSPDLLGIDYIAPDVTYVEQNLHKLRAIVITHGHLDHIGALKVVLPRLNFPLIYGPALALGLIEKQMEEIGLAKKLRMKVVKPRDVIEIGKFKIEFFRVNHSIPDGHGVCIETPEGRIVHTGDFKFDFTPAIDEPADLMHMADIGRRGVDLLMVDSTNAPLPGHTKSEYVVGESLEQIVRNTDGRIIITTFSSLIGRIQQLITYARKYDRTVFLSGRSMLANVEIAKKLGFIHYPPGAVKQITKETQNLPPEKVMIITTGCQGEEMSALARMAFGSHPHIKIKKGDTIVLSATPIPGNERGVVNLMNNLTMLGANIIDNDAMDVHTSGHARQDDIKLMLSLIKPKYYLPVHGERYMRVANGKIAQVMGIPEKNVFSIPNGGILEFSNRVITESKEKIDVGYIMVDGSSEGLSGSKVIAERQVMARDGVIVLTFKVDRKTKKLLAAPKMISKGFIYMEELQEVTKGVIAEAKRLYDSLCDRMDLGKTDKQTELVRALRADLSRYVDSKTDRIPMILPIIIEQ